MTRQLDGRPSAGRILITGGCGFIGSNLAAHYLAKGWEVVAYDNFSRPGAESNAAWLESQANGRLTILMGDVRDYEPLCEAMQGARVVVHLAAQVAVTTSVQNPREDFLINALGGFNVLEAARNCASDPVVLYASTNKVYGGMQGPQVREQGHRYELPEYPHGMPEEFPIDLHSPYGCSKGAIDLYMLDYARIYGVKTVVFRQSCIYGPRQFGIEDQGWVAHFAISAVLGRPITIYGDGKQVRDVLHVDDLIGAFGRAVENIEVCRGQAYNLGGGPINSVSLLELVHRLEAGLGRPIALSFSDWRPGDQKVYISDVRKAEHDLGWTPRIGIEEGLRDLSRWVMNNVELFASKSSDRKHGILSLSKDAVLTNAEPNGDAYLGLVRSLSVEDQPQSSSTEPIRNQPAEPSQEDHPVLLPRLKAAETTARRMKAVRTAHKDSILSSPKETAR